MRIAPIHPDGAQRSPWTAVWTWLGSLEFTLVCLALVLLMGVVVALTALDATTGMLLPLPLCALNLAVVLIRNERLRLHGGLFIFHAALLAFLLLLPVSRLTYLKGNATVVTGETFHGDLMVREQGPWHGEHLHEAAFRNEGFEIDYAEGFRRRHTRNAVGWQEQGQWIQAVIGDDRPLIRQGYRFYTTADKGFAAMFLWWKNGEPLPERGTVLFQAPGDGTYVSDGVIPGTEIPLHVRLEVDGAWMDHQRETRFPPELPQKVESVIGGESHLWLVGEEMALPEGRLRFEGVRTWMGYAVFHDWTRPWLLASLLVGVGGLMVHYGRKVWANPWCSSVEPR